MIERRTRPHHKALNEVLLKLLVKLQASQRRIVPATSAANTQGSYPMPRTSSWAVAIFEPFFLMVLYADWSGALERIDLRSRAVLVYRSGHIPTTLAVVEPAPISTNITYCRVSSVRREKKKKKFNGRGKCG